MEVNLKKDIQAALNESIFPDDWKNGNASVQKKDVKYAKLYYKSAPSIC